MGEDALPATWQLGVALGAGFVLFNQWLLLGLAAVSSGRGELETARRLEVASWACGAIVGAFLVAVWVTARPLKASDLAAAAGVAAVAWAAESAAWETLISGGVLAFALANAFAAIWLARGLWRARSSKKRENR